MARWELPLELEASMRASSRRGRPPGQARALFGRIAQALVDEIRRGRLRPGQRLPGSRTLAASLEVHRNTVVAALAELEAQGWVETRPARGTFVSEALPETAPWPGAATRAGSVARSSQVGQGQGHRPALPRPPALSTLHHDFRPLPRGALSLAAGVPDARRFPAELLARAWRRVVRRAARTLLAYGHPAGHEGLRRALGAMLSERRGLLAPVERVLVTRGSQQALQLCAQGLLPRGSAVAVEALGYRPAWDAFRLAGVEPVPVPVDGRGLDVETLERVVRDARVRAVYVTPHHQYPTTVTLAPERRMALLALARRRRLWVLEDDYDHEFHYEGRPVLPLGHEDPDGLVVSIGTLSKVLAPGLRLGFLVAGAEVVDRLARLRAAMDRQGDLTMEAAVAELLEEGELQRHVRKMRVVYQARRDALAGLLAEKLGSTLTFEVPRGGISFWARVHGVDAEAWAERCAAAGVWLGVARRYTFDGRKRSALRLVYASHTPTELSRAVAVMTACLPPRPHGSWARTED